jgi:L-ascorbate metabolism protein UlaG (beta-lactamase superfamily)
MCNKKVYLKPSVKLEPLIWQWYAWSYLISPITCSKLISKHVRLMESYMAAPDVHYQASKNPDLLGGSFIAVEKSSSHKVDALLNQHKNECEELLRLAEEFKSFDLKLQNIAKGYSLEKLYEQLPHELKGCVELIYDYNNHPSIRIIEKLFYKKYYPLIRKGQTIAVSDTTEDARPFSFSTPRFRAPEEIHLNIPFDSSLIDVLSKMRYEPVVFEDIIKSLNLSDSEIITFKDFLTTDEPEIRPGYNEDDLRIRYFGHASVLIETSKVSILVDPLINYNYDFSSECFSLMDLPETIDYVLITHAHQDHLVLETLLQIRHKIKTIIVPKNQIGSFIDPSLKMLLHQVGFDLVIDMDEFEKLEVSGGNILSVPFLGEHADTNILAKMAYCVTLKNKKLLFCADSNNLDNTLYEHLYDYVGNIDYLILGMECEGAPLNWVFGSLFNKLPNKQDSESRRFSGSNCAKACKIVKTLRCKNVFIYAMAMEPWLTHIMALDYSEESTQIIESNKFIVWCEDNNINVLRPFLKMELIV